MTLESKLQGAPAHALAPRSDCSGHGQNELTKIFGIRGLAMGRDDRQSISKLSLAMLSVKVSGERNQSFFQSNSLAATTMMSRVALRHVGVERCL